LFHFQVLQKLPEASMKDPYAPRCLLLRQLCCHPAVSEEWQRLLALYASGRNPVLTLEDLRGKMVSHKEKSLARLREQVNIKAA
jgi:hypothetical protein